MRGYAPGEQPRPGERVVKLNTNEAPWPPSPRVEAAIRAVSTDRLRRYPDPRATALREAAARRHGLTAEHVLAGNGSDDVLTVLIRTFVTPGATVAAPWPTYSLYPTLCQIQGASFRGVPWRDGWRLPADALLDGEPAAIFVANPNAPSGTSVPADELAALADRLENRPLLIDEAYADYADFDCVAVIERHPNVIVSRSLSKGFALAGMRVGYALAHPDVVAEMDKVRDSYNLDALAQAAGTAALEDLDYARQMWSHVRSERGRVSETLAGLGFELTQSRANFVLAARDDAPDLFAHLKRAGVLVRHWDTPDLRQYLRVTIGTTKENDAFLDVLM